MKILRTIRKICKAVLSIIPIFMKKNNYRKKLTANWRKGIVYGVNKERKRILKDKWTLCVDLTRIIADKKETKAKLKVLDSIYMETLNCLKCTLEGTPKSFKKAVSYVMRSLLYNYTEDELESIFKFIGVPYVAKENKDA